jgi:putative transposase
MRGSAQRLYPVIQSLIGQGINVQQACIALGVSQSGYYAGKDRPDSPTTLRRIWLAGEIADIHKESGGTYGALRVTAELRYGRNIVAGHNAVEDIMRQLGLRGLPTRRLPRGAKLRAVTSQDLVRREFKRKAPNELWLTDITEHPTREGKVYCCAVLDTFSRKIGGWSIDSTQTTSLVLNALGIATQRRPSRDGLVMHSDRSVQLGLNRSSQQPPVFISSRQFLSGGVVIPCLRGRDDPEGAVHRRDR